MGKCFSKMSVLLAAMLVLIAMPFVVVLAGSNDLPEPPDVKITDGVLSWGEMDGMSGAYIEIDGLRSISLSKTTLQYDLKNRFAQEGFAAGSYKITLYLQKTSGNTYSFIAKWVGTYSYTPAGPQCGKVTDLTWDESKQKLTWKSAALGEGEEYVLKVKKHSLSKIKTTETEFPLARILVEGMNTYEISVCIHKYGCPDGEAATLTKTYTHTLKPMDLTMDERGVLHWEKLPEVEYYKLIWKATDGSYVNSRDVAASRTSYDVEYEVIRAGCCGKEILVTLQAISYFGNDGTRTAIPLSSKTEYTYVSMTQVYPLSYCGTNLNSRNVNDYTDIFRYAPDTRTLTFVGADITKELNSGNSALFSSSEDLTVKGTTTITFPHKVFECAGTLSFAKNSDIVIGTSDDAVAVSADKIVFNGKNLLVNAKEGTAVQAQTSIKFGSAFGEGRFISASGKSTCAVTSSAGKISLGNAVILLPSGGNLGSDSRNIYQSDKVTVASDAAVRSSSYTAPSDAIPVDEAHFPDALFRQYIIDEFIDRNRDMLLDSNERTSVKDLYFSFDDGSEESSAFTSLQGIEYFPELESLGVVGSAVSSLDISNNTKLKYLQVIYANLDYIDISNNPWLVDTYKLGKKTTRYNRNKKIYVDIYLYREDPNDYNSQPLGELYLNQSTQIDTVGPHPPTDISVEIGKSIQYVVSEYFSASSITWSVGNTSVATVDATGKVTGKSFGNTYLYAKCQNGKTYKCLVRVTYPALKINYTEKTLYPTQTYAFTVSNAYGQKITWSVGNTSVATVDASGKVTAKSIANTYLYAKSADGRTAKCLLKVVDPGTLGINYTEKTVYLGQTFTFTAKNARVFTPVWSVGNTAIAKVDSASGKVTPVSVGNTYLYVKTSDGRSARCLVKVVDPGPLSIRYTEKTIKVGSSFKFTATNTAGQTVSWRVGNSAVATVDASGNVTGKSVANTYLYAKTPDGREVRCLLRIVA